MIPDAPPASGGDAGAVGRARAALAVLAPLRVEAWALRAGLRGARVVRTGGGPRRARRSAAALQHSADSVLAVAGLCGALAPDLEPGDVVVASALRGPGAVRPLEGFDALARFLGALPLRVQVGVIRSEEHVIRGKERERLRAEGALAVDTESFWLAEAAKGRPLAVLRIVVDGPRHELLRPATLANALHALFTLRKAAPALEAWSRRSEAS